MDSTAASAVFALSDRELWLVTACASPRRGGLIATFVNKASLTPELPRVVVGLAHCHHTCDLVQASGAFALHLLGEAHVDLVWQFGLRSGRDVDKLAGHSIQQGLTSSPLLTDTLGWLDCRVEAQLDTGDRTIYLAEVVQARLNHAAPPLTYKRLLQLAPADKLLQLRQQELHDSTLDVAAIRAWRQRGTADGLLPPGLPS